MVYTRSHGRSHDSIRTVRVHYNAFGYAPGSVLFSLGNTKVLCSVTLQNSVPPFLKGKKTGWLSAEYAMLPSATKQRVQRSSSSAKPNGRSIEISRLIGRSLRTILNLDEIGERTIIVDCDVLQADGGTRTAAITGAYLALAQAQEQWLASGLIQRSFLIDAVAAISVGMLDNTPLLDIDFAEDSMIDSDFNFVLTASGKIIEIQGTAEQKPLAWDHFEQIKKLAVSGVQQLFEQSASQPVTVTKSRRTQAPLFSLANRMNKQ